MRGSLVLSLREPNGYRVEFEISEGFILDDLIAGVLDNIVYTLGGRLTPISHPA